MPDKVHVNSGPPDPDGWYSDTDLLLMLSIGESVQQKAREAGHLKFTQTGTTFLYRWSDVTDWLENGARTDKAKAVPATPLQKKLDRRRSAIGGAVHSASSGAPAGVSNSPLPQPRSNTVSATAEFHEAVAAAMAKGKTRAQAGKSVMRTNPALRRAMLIEGNRNKPQALRVIDDV